LIRALSANLTSITPDVLAALRSPSGRTRILSIGVSQFGLMTYLQELEKYCAGRDDVELVYVTMHNSLLERLWSRFPNPRSKARIAERMVSMWRRRMRSWLSPRGPLPVDLFDAVVVCPQLYALGAVDVKRAGTATKLAVILDATVANTIRDMNDDGPVQRRLLEEDRAIFQTAELVGCMSTWAADSVRNDFGVPPERICPMLPTVGIVDLPPRPPVDPSKPVKLVFVGRHWWRKGLPELLRWHQQHWATRAELHVIGNEAELTIAKGARNVIVHGTVPRERLMRELMPAMDLFVLPTVQDMSPAAIAEAMAAGLPVVSARLAGIPDMVVHGETGLLVTPRDEAGYMQAIGSLIEDPALCRRMGEAARRRAETHFRREVVYGRFVDRLIALTLPAAGKPAPAGYSPA